MNQIKRKCFILTICLCSIFILIQHKYVFMYFDDYGYASITYVGNGSINGMNYGFKDIVDFLEYHYINWGGRILYFLFEIVLFRIGGVNLIQTVQAIIIILISVLSGKIVSKIINCDELQCIALSVILYGIFDIVTLKDGVYWYTASVLYVWPLLPLLIGVYLVLAYESKATLYTYIWCCISFFLAAFSQEQVAVLVILFSITVCLATILLEGRNKLNKLYIAILGASCLGGAVTILAPGNFVRVNDTRYEEFYNMSLLERIVQNFEPVIDINIGKYNGVFLIVFSFFVGVAISVFLKKKYIGIISILFTVYFLFEQFYEISDVCGIGVRVLWIIFYFISLMFYYVLRKDYFMMSLFIGGLCSQGMLMVLPSISTRSHTMLEFIMHIMIVECIVDLFNRCFSKYIRIGLKTGLALIAVYSIFNFCDILDGYRDNDEINQINHYKLVEAGANYAVDGEVSNVVLYKLKDDLYANMMPYHGGFNHIEVWMKNYYELPQSVEFYWLDIEKSAQCQVIGGSWFDDYWLGKQAEILIQTDTNAVVEVSFSNVAELEGQKITCTIGDNTTVYPIRGTKVIEIEVPAGEHILTVIAEKTFYPDNGDIRELSGQLKIEVY